MEVSTMKIIFAIAMMLIFIMTGCQRADSGQQEVREEMPKEDKMLRVGDICRRLFLVHGGRF